MWKFHDLSIIQILLEIKVDEFRASHLEALNFDFYEFLKFLNTKFTKFRALKIENMTVLKLL